jgi:CRISPR-associated endonuclease Csy4
MNHYVDIDLRPDPEFPPYQLLAALYAKLHRALVAMDSDAIGVSFPGVDLKAPHLGVRLRLHGELDVLSSLLASDWLSGMREHVALTQPAAVPGNAKHRSVRRVQVKSSPERMRRRLMRRQNIDAQEAQQRIPDESARLTQLPFIQLRSTSTCQTFRLFIEHGPVEPIAVAGHFNAYGLSQGATIPWF